MRTLFLTTAAFAALVMVAPIGNAHADGYRAATTLEQVKAQCELVADGMVQPEDPYYGDPKYAGFSTFGSAIGGAIRHARDYDNCMTLHGYAKNDGSEASAPATPAYSAPTYAAPAPATSAPRRATRKTAARAPHEDMSIAAIGKCYTRHSEVPIMADGRTECDVNPSW
jgi:hypothetical protein